jgi:hypothetical protein
MRRTGIKTWRHLLRFRTFCVPREGFGAADCLDASAGDTHRGRFALADGASEGGPDSGRWARVLVDDFVQGDTTSSLPSPAAGGGLSGGWVAKLPVLQARWRSEVAAVTVPSDSPWYVAEHARARDNDAFATFLGLVMHPAPGPNTPWRWQALAVGDSCLFQVRSGVLIERFPMSGVEEFNTTPWLVGSHTSPEEVYRDRSRTVDGENWPEDRLYLMTDALAEWFLLRWEVDEKPWKELETFVNPAAADDEFADWVGDLRKGGQLRNDDVTMAAIWLE